jgi:hypothetical protein
MKFEKKKEIIKELSKNGNINTASGRMSNDRADLLFEKYTKERLKINRLKDIFIVSKDGEDKNIIKVNKNNKPLLFEKLGVNKTKDQNILLRKIIQKNKITVEKINIYTNVTSIREYISVHVVVKFEFEYANKIFTRFTDFNFKGQKTKIQDAIDKEVNEFLAGIGVNHTNLEIINVKITSLDNDSGNFTYDYSTNKLREQNVLSLVNLYGDNIELNKTNGNCVRDYLKSIWKTMADKTIEKLGNEEGVSSQEIKELCKQKNIKCLIYNIYKDIVSSNYPEKKNKNFKSLICMAYNNHLYPIKNECLLKIRKYKDCEIELKNTQEIQELFKKTIYEDKKVPAEIKLYVDDDCNTIIGSFVNDNKILFTNEDYDKCIKILDNFGIKDMKFFSVNLKNITQNIEKLYIKSNVNSFFPYTYLKNAFNYMINEELIDYTRKMKSIDKNKCFPYCLRNLEYLITCDVRQETIKVFNNDFDNNFIGHHLYIVSPVLANILIPNKNIYHGAYLKYALKEGVQMIVHEEITAERTDNYFKDMIDDIYNKVKSGIIYMQDAKMMLNVMIGKFKAPFSYRNKMIVKGIINKNEREQGKEYMKYDDNYYFEVVEKKTLDGIYNRYPIHIQILDNSNLLMYKKMKSLKLKDADVIAIHTDNIIYYDNGINIDYEKTDNLIDGWKDTDINFSKAEPYRMINPELTFTKMNEYSIHENKNELVIGDAGNGKSYDIKNKIIPNNKDYIVLTPSHPTLKAYKNNYNSSVIQTYTLQNRIPNEECIIIDEIGLCDRPANDLIYKCYLLGKKIYALGDFTQLLPVNEKAMFDNHYYLKSIYGKIIQKNENYRNDFTNDFYNQLRDTNWKDTQNEKIMDQIINKYLNDKDPDVYIAYKNETAHNKSIEVMKEKGHLNSEGKIIDLVNIPVICKTNDIKELYNNFKYDIVEKVDNDIYKLENGYELNVKDIGLKKDFIYGYARTLYSTQGDQFRKIGFCAEDKHFFKNGRAFYTAVSRLWTK